MAGAGIVTQVLPRQFSARQQRRLQAWEIGKRWHEWPAGRIFPATVRYRDGGGGRAGARRLGIAGKATCAAAADAAVVRVLAQHGCVAVLRATYTDATDALAVTVGVVVLPRASAASASFRALTGQGMRADAGVRAVPFAPLAGGFRDPQRQAFSAINLAGPYLVLSASGYADGRPQVHGVTDAYAVGEMQSLADGVARSIASRLGATPPPLRCPGAPGC